MTAAASFNGGRSQANFYFPQIGGDYPFINYMKTAQAWSAVNNANTPITPDMLDANGYPTTFTNALGVATGGLTTVFYVPSQLARPGNYVITWTGNGTIRTNMSNTLVSGSKTGSGGAGRYVFSTTDFRFDVGITALPVTDLKVFHADDETALNAGQIFGTKFKQRLAEANFGVLRFLDWQRGNKTNVTTWATRKPVGYVFYDGHETRGTSFGGVTTLSGAAYSVAAPSGWGGLVDKATVTAVFNASYGPTLVTFTNGSASISMPAHGLSIDSRLCFSKNSSATMPTNFTNIARYFVVSVPDADHVTVSATQGGAAIVAGSAGSGTIYGNPLLTLNVGGTGDVDILGETSDFLTFQLNSYPLAGTYQSMATFVYDATLNAWIKQGGDLAASSRGIDNGVPPELMLQLCAEIGAHPYFVTPPLAIDPATDYMPSLAAYCRDNGPSWMIPRFEGPNETWNTAAGFYQTGYANAKAVAYGWGADFHNWYGKAVSVLGQAVSTVYSADRTKYQVLCGVQTAAGTSAGSAASSNPRLASTKYLLQATQAPYTATPASSWATHICTAQYFSPSDHGAAAETTEAAAYAGASFTGSIAGTALTASGVTGAIVVGMTIQGVGVNGNAVLPGTLITAGSGSSWTVNNSQTVANQPMKGGVDLTAPVTFANTSNSGIGNFTLSKCLTLYTNWKTWAQGFGIQKMCGYEGGYSPDYASGGNSNVDRMIAASKSAPNLVPFTTTNYNNFVGLTGGGFVAEFPACYFFAGSINITGYSQGVWSVLEDLYQTPNPPQWEAIRLFNAGLSRIFVRN